MRRVLLPVIALALALAACGGDDDVSRQQFRDALEDGGMSAEQADCTTDEVFGQLEPSEITAYYGDGDVEAQTAEVVEAAATSCP